MDDSSRLAEQIPQTIGRYQVQEGIGYGAMGAVYKAFDPLIKRTLAIKTLRLDIPRSSPQYRSFIDRFHHEARISGTLSHPNIVTLFDIGEEGGVPYLAMEFVEGETLASMIERGVRFKPEKVINLVSQIASAVDYAHSKGVIHRDIKPSNLILFGDDRVKVTDFGIAKLGDHEITQSGTLLGTPAYMSPEQAMGEKLDGRSDIFSLGVCAFEMLSGEQPFAGPNVTSILYKLVHVEPIEPANLETNGLVPQKWREVFGRVLAKKPDDRYQTATEFVQDLEYCLGAWFGGIGDVATAPAPAGVPATTVMPAVAAGAVPVVVAPTPPIAPATTVPPIVPAAAAPAAAPAPAEVPPTVMMKAPAAPPSPAGPVEGTVLMPAARAGAAPSPAPEVGPTVLMPAVGAPAARRGANGGDVPATVLVSAAALGAAPNPDRSPKPDTPPRPPAAAPVMATASAPLPAAPAATAPPAASPADAKKTATRVWILVGVGVVLVLGALGTIGLWFLVNSLRAESPLPSLPPRVVRRPTPPPPTAAAAPVPVEPSPAIEEVKGVLHVGSQPAGAVVSVDGEARGTTPMDVGELSLGDHQVRFDLKGFEVATETVTLTTEEPRAAVEVTLKRAVPAVAPLEIRSTPEGALVKIDGIPVGSTPFRQPRATLGRHTVEVSKEGYATWTGTADVRAGKTPLLDVQLHFAARAAPSADPSAVDTRRVYLENEVDTPPRQVSGKSVSYNPKLKKGQRIAVAATFVVTETGQVSDVAISESGGKELDEALLNAMRTWTFAPGVKRGVNVRTRVVTRRSWEAR